MSTWANRGKPPAAWQGPELIIHTAAHPLISGSGVFKQPEPALTSRDVYADRGYPGARRSEMLQVLGYREHIQRKAKPKQPLSDCQQGRNKRIAKTRARVEHPFAQMRHMGGKLIRTIGQARATVAMTMMATCYNIKRLARFLEDGVDAFFKTRPSKSGVRLRGVSA